MKLQKWNRELHKYEPYEIPNTWNIGGYRADMNDIVNCAHCGKRVRYGDCYSSLEIHNDIGLSYAVCKECYFNGELLREFEAKEVTDGVYYDDKGNLLAIIK